MGNGELLFHGDRGEFGKIKRVLWMVAMVAHSVNIISAAALYI